MAPKLILDPYLPSFCEETACMVPLFAHDFSTFLLPPHASQQSVLTLSELLFTLTHAEHEVLEAWQGLSASGSGSGSGTQQESQRIEYQSWIQEFVVWRSSESLTTIRDRITVLSSLSPTKWSALEAVCLSFCFRVGGGLRFPTKTFFSTPSPICYMLQKWSPYHIWTGLRLYAWQRTRGPRECLVLEDSKGGEKEGGKTVASTPLAVAARVGHDFWKLIHRPAEADEAPLEWAAESIWKDVSHVLDDPLNKDSKAEEKGVMIPSAKVMDNRDIFLTESHVHQWIQSITWQGYSMRSYQRILQSALDNHQEQAYLILHTWYKELRNRHPLSTHWFLPGLLMDNNHRMSFVSLFDYFFPHSKSLVITGWDEEKDEDPDEESADEGEQEENDDEQNEGDQEDAKFFRRPVPIDPTSFAAIFYTTRRSIKYAKKRMSVFYKKNKKKSIHMRKTKTGRRPTLSPEYLNMRVSLESRTMDVSLAEALGHLLVIAQVSSSVTSAACFHTRSTLCCWQNYAAYRKALTRVVTEWRRTHTMDKFATELYLERDLAYRCTPSSSDSLRTDQRTFNIIIQPTAEGDDMQEEESSSDAQIKTALQQDVVTRWINMRSNLLSMEQQRPSCDLRTLYPLTMWVHDKMAHLDLRLLLHGEHKLYSCGTFCSELLHSSHHKWMILRKEGLLHAMHDLFMILILGYYMEVEWGWDMVQWQRDMIQRHKVPVERLISVVREHTSAGMSSSLTIMDGRTERIQKAQAIRYEPLFLQPSLYLYQESWTTTTTTTESPMEEKKDGEKETRNNKSEREYGVEEDDGVEVSFPSPSLPNIPGPEPGSFDHTAAVDQEDMDFTGDVGGF